MIFEHPWHNQIITILRSVRSEFLCSCQTYFGGGTLLALDYGEYRLSRDIDFLCPNGRDYSRLRTAIYEQGYGAIFTEVTAFALVQEPRTDQYGVRFPILINGQTIKFEIISEGRISFDSPSFPEWSPVACLSIGDRITEKLLANSDRWADASTNAKDLIDLAILKTLITFPDTAIEKAEAVYPVIAPLQRAIQNFQNKPDYRLRCYERLSIKYPPQVINGLDRLALEFNLDATERTFRELVNEWD